MLLKILASHNTMAKAVKLACQHADAVHESSFAHVKTANGQGQQNYLTKVDAGGHASPALEEAGGVDGEDEVDSLRRFKSLVELLLIMFLQFATSSCTLPGQLRSVIIVWCT